MPFSKKKENICILCIFFDIVFIGMICIYIYIYIIHTYQLLVMSVYHVYVFLCDDTETVHF